MDSSLYEQFVQYLKDNSQTIHSDYDALKCVTYECCEDVDEEDVVGLISADNLVARFQAKMFFRKIVEPAISKRKLSLKRVYNPKFDVVNLNARITPSVCPDMGYSGQLLLSDVEELLKSYKEELSRNEPFNVNMQCNHLMDVDLAAINEICHTGLIQSLDLSENRIRLEAKHTNELMMSILRNVQGYVNVSRNPFSNSPLDTFINNLCKHEPELFDKLIFIERENLELMDKWKDMLPEDIDPKHILEHHIKYYA